MKEKTDIPPSVTKTKRYKEELRKKDRGGRVRENSELPTYQISSRQEKKYSPSLYEICVPGVKNGREKKPS